MKISTAIISSLTLLSLNIAGLTQVQAQTDVTPEPDGITFLQTEDGEVPVTLLGNGCPDETAKGIVNGDTLSITFKEFEAKALSPLVESKSCNLRIGLNIPSGFTVQPVNITYVGFADVPDKGSAEVNVRLLFQGRNIVIPNLNETFAAGTSKVWTKEVQLDLAPINACNKPVSSIFGINTSLTARARNVAANQETQIRVDTIDTGLGPVLYRIKFAYFAC
ncbi:DUF4360 domain-containing protein [Nostoc sp. FACHB-152]|uniref:DUF4360 domain-containing protein n=1 Tax=unclassified Nostoc TaxID=2593658 RepID=UPI00168711AC|nr:MULTISPECIES: DUF4360 domain-containing protein [unclassified Nostoc]MBD2447961.1 DUF4360 domain-containing protein [Nostoc sp. FACHB-152]MBD2466068.1 DUF4360 domain-containing protein [Nostoc sp. FACHB-145]